MADIEDDSEAVNISTYQLEDFTLFTEVDPQNNITITPSLITILDEQQHISAYVRKQMVTSGDFTYNFGADWDSSHSDDPLHLSSHLGIFALTNGSNDIADMAVNEEGLAIFFEDGRDSGYAPRVRLHDFQLATTAFMLIPEIPFSAWFTIKRVGSQAIMEIYSNEARTELIVTRTINTTVGNYAYLFAHQSYRWGYSDAYASGKIKNMYLLGI